MIPWLQFHLFSRMNSFQCETQFKRELDQAQMGSRCQNLRRTQVRSRLSIASAHRSGTGSLCLTSNPIFQNPMKRYHSRKKSWNAFLSYSVGETFRPPSHLIPHFRASRTLWPQHFQLHQHKHFHLLHGSFRQHQRSVWKIFWHKPTFAGLCRC